MSSVARRTSAGFPLPPALDFLERLWRLNHALERRSSRMQASIGVTAQQRLVLRCIGAFPGISPGQLAELLHLDPGTLSAAIRRLEGRRLVKRARDAVDHRRARLSLTAAGRRLDVPSPGTVEAAAERLLASRSARSVAAGLALLEEFTALLEAPLP